MNFNPCKGSVERMAFVLTVLNLQNITTDLEEFYYFLGCNSHLVR
jgi:hypothetical protein